MLSEVMNHTGANNSDIVFIDGNTKSVERYRELYNTTKFCLAPHGGWLPAPGST